MREMPTKTREMRTKLADYFTISNDFCGAFEFHNLLDIHGVNRSVSRQNRAKSSAFREVSYVFRAVSLDYRAVSGGIVQYRAVAGFERGRDTLSVCLFQ